MNLSYFIVYILFFIIYLKDDYYNFKKNLYWIYKFKDKMRKINNLVKIPKNKANIIISHFLESY